MEIRIVKIVYEFSDKKKLTLKGKELDNYILICNLTSDYLLPVDKNSKVCVGKIIRGFTPCPKI